MESWTSQDEAEKTSPGIGVRSERAGISCLLSFSRELQWGGMGEGGGGQQQEQQVSENQGKRFASLL